MKPSRYICIIFYLISQSIFGQSDHTFQVQGACGMCQSRIESTALEAGAKEAHWDMASKILTIKTDETGITTIREALASAGHDNDPFFTHPDTYGALPLCCQYRPEATKSIGSEDQGELPAVLKSDHEVIGRVLGYDDEHQKIPLIGANVISIMSEEGTVTDADGFFSFEKREGNENLYISYIGYNPQTIGITRDGMLEITLSDGILMDDIVVTYRAKTTSLSLLNPLNVENIGQGELRKAACCNLAESFETNPSIDASFTDAITGTRQIQMLGLSGPYVQITRELIPEIRGIANIYGLTFTPGPWIEGIQLNKGAGSVMNGFESITGQINVELKKPDQGERVHINAYASEGSRLELNVNARQKLSEKWSTSLLLHGKNMTRVHDRNRDNFLDHPLQKDYIAINRWKWFSDKGWVGQFGIKGTSLDHKSGQSAVFQNNPNRPEDRWKMEQRTKRIDLWAKTGYVFPKREYASFGFQIAGSAHDQKASYGSRPYNADFKSFYSNLMYQSIIDNTNHTFKTGLSYQLDQTEEEIDLLVYKRTESVPGAFFEYTYLNGDKFAMVAGLRLDHHNQYGAFITPRLHLKYNLNPQSALKISGGRGLRTANIFAENVGLFASSRRIDIEQSSLNDNPYGLEAEIAWNYGVNYVHKFSISQREAVFSVDLYRTHFQNQVIVDWEDPRTISFYNLDGASYSNSFQIKMEYELIERFDTRLAYRLFDVQTDYRGGRLEKPLVSKHRAFINLAYTTKNKWAFDWTLNWQGKKRLPNTASNPSEFRLEDRSEDYLIMNAQINKSWGRFEAYVGGENLLNFKQENAIIAASDPLGGFFDASIVWGPVFGRNVYTGIRYTLN